MAVKDSSKSTKPTNVKEKDPILNSFINYWIDLNSKKHWWLCFWIITAIAFATRFYKISEPNHVWYDR